MNAKPIGKGGEYILPARTAQEIAETPAADDQLVSDAIAEGIDVVRDPARQANQVTQVNHDGDELWS